MPFVEEYMDICSEVATQDSDWVSVAITKHVLPELLSKHAQVAEMFGSSDFGGHFANNKVLTLWGKLNALLGADVVWNSASFFKIKQTVFFYTLIQKLFYRL